MEARRLFPFGALSAKTTKSQYIAVIDKGAYNLGIFYHHTEVFISHDDLAMKAASLNSAREVSKGGRRKVIAFRR